MQADRDSLPIFPYRDALLAAVDEHQVREGASRSRRKSTQKVDANHAQSAWHKVDASHTQSARQKVDASHTQNARP
eukprot:4310983-Pyramimonas_sp.AAC.2